MRFLIGQSQNLKSVFPDWIITEFKVFLVSCVFPGLTITEFN